MNSVCDIEGDHNSSHTQFTIFVNCEKSGAQKAETFTMIGCDKLGCFTPPTLGVPIIFANIQLMYARITSERSMSPYASTVQQQTHTHRHGIRIRDVRTYVRYSLDKQASHVHSLTVCGPFTITSDQHEIIPTLKCFTCPYVHARRILQ